MDLRAPNIERLLRAFEVKTPDRVPMLELLVNTPTLEHVMGRRLAASLTGTYAVSDPAVHESGGSGAGRPLPQLYAQQDPALSTMNITPEEYVEFRRSIGMRAIAIADHDVLAGVRRGAAAAQRAGQSSRIRPSSLAGTRVSA